MEVQRRASLAYEEYREALAAHPDAIDVPLQQLDAGDVFLAERDGAIVGFGAVLLRADGDADLDSIFVLPELWKQGIGRVLLEESNRVAVARGARMMHVVANPNALAFYKACGFALLGETQTRFGTGIRMAKQLGRYIPKN